jgi:hypothetical protein
MKSEDATILCESSFLNARYADMEEVAPVLNKVHHIRLDLPSNSIYLTITWISHHQHRTSTLFWKLIHIFVALVLLLKSTLNRKSRANQPQRDRSRPFYNLFWTQGGRFASLRRNAPQPRSE